jgi:hypothetical protein
MKMKTTRPRPTPGPLPEAAALDAPLEELYTATDAARLLVMSPENVRRLTRLGVLQACAVTVSPLRPILLYRRAAVEALAATRARPQRLAIPTERRRQAELVRRRLVEQARHRR